MADGEMPTRWNALRREAIVGWANQRHTHLPIQLSRESGNARWQLAKTRTYRRSDHPIRNPITFTLMDVSSLVDPKLGLHASALSLAALGALAAIGRVRAARTLALQQMTASRRRRRRPHCHAGATFVHDRFATERLRAGVFFVGADLCLRSARKKASSLPSSIARFFLALSTASMIAQASSR